jgi:hypothetical protein
MPNAMTALSSTHRTFIGSVVMIRVSAGALVICFWLIILYTIRRGHPLPHCTKGQPEI